MTTNALEARIRALEDLVQALEALVKGGVAKRTGSKLERLESVGLIRGGVTYGLGHTSHSTVRAELGDEMPNISVFTDEEGFITSTGRFVSRDDAVPIAVIAGQISDIWWNRSIRKLLSSDINWKAGK